MQHPGTAAASLSLKANVGHSERDVVYSTKIQLEVGKLRESLLVSHSLYSQSDIRQLVLRTRCLNNSDWEYNS